MTDYRKMPLGPLGLDRIGDVVKCPHCGEHGLELEEFTYPLTNSKEKETVYLHLESPVQIQKKEHGKAVVITEIMMLECRTRRKSPEETRPE